MGASTSKPGAVNASKPKVANVTKPVNTPANAVLAMPTINSRPTMGGSAMKMMGGSAMNKIMDVSAMNKLMSGSAMKMMGGFGGCKNKMGGTRKLKRKMMKPTKKNRK